MNTQLQSIIDRQLERMRELREDAQDIADTIADEVWDRFEVDIEEATGDSFMFDFAASVRMGLASGLAVAYDDAFDRHVSGLFERLQNELRTAGLADAAFDDGRVDLAGLRKGLKLRRHADELIGQAIERAKPGLIGMLFLARDPASDAWEREHAENAARVREKLLDMRGKLKSMMIEDTLAVLQSARLAYANWLEALRTKLATQQQAAA